ncbi:MAG: hypothetical protein CMM00_11185 [Rhodopirellula sp.]|nr:hypothetical protein [Rhodopirellula sp.]
MLMMLLLVGIGLLIHSNLELSTLRRIHADLRDEIGLLEVEDPTQVTMVAVPTPNDVVPPGVEQAHVWRYRIHFPANYGASFSTQGGLVAANSPQGRGGSSSSWGNPNKTPEELLTTIALVKSDGKWICCRDTGGSSSTISLPDDFDLESLDDLVIETPVALGDKSRSFETDEAICLIRLREKNLAKKRNGETENDLYRGFHLYVYGDKHRAAFDAWARGDTTSMQETTP